MEEMHNYYGKFPNFKSHRLNERQLRSRRWMKEIFLGCFTVEPADGAVYHVWFYRLTDKPPSSRNRRRSGAPGARTPSKIQLKGQMTQIKTRNGREKYHFVQRWVQEKVTFLSFGLKTSAAKVSAACERKDLKLQDDDREENVTSSQVC